MRAGEVLNVDTPFLTFTRAALKRLGLRIGDYVCVSSAERDTAIVRLIRKPHFRGMTPRHAYLDVGSLHLLNVDAGDTLLVCLSDDHLEMP